MSAHHQLRLSKRGALFLICLLLVSPGWLNASRPNIIVILCDDLGYGDLGCYGHPFIQTPVLDKMAAEGIRFADFYSAAPVCSPSRVGLLTGRSPNRAGVYDWISEGNEPKPDAREQVHMRDSEVTIPKLLKQGGYATAMAGKWHCNSLFNSPQQPQPDDAGFDHWLATQNNAAPSHANPINFVRNGKPVGPVEGYSCQIVADEGVEWITEQNSNHPDQPFFLYLAFHEPHEPVASPEALIAKYRPVAVSEKEATYFANVENVDHAVGKVLRALKELNIDENTLVIFTSDNGPETLNRYPRAGYSWGRPDPLRGMKLWTTEAGFRVAGIMRWPERIIAGITVDEPVSSLDFLPTFCELAGVDPPGKHRLDGTSFLPALQNLPLGRKKPLIWVYYNAINEHRVAMRLGKWKIMARLDLPKFQNLHSGNLEAVKAARLVEIEIYDLAADIGEVNNLADQNANRLARFTNRIRREYRSLLKSSPVWEPQVN